MNEKNPNGVQLLLRAVVKDPDGKVLHDTGQKPSKSFVIQWLEVISALFRGISLDATDIDNNETQLIYNSDYAYRYAYIAGDVGQYNRGIVVGTGDTTPTNTDYKLENVLTEGVEVGNITYGAMVIGTATIVGSNVDLEMHRIFTNNTGSTITVKEVGIYCYNIMKVTHPVHCLIRDVLASPVDVPDKCSLTVYYTWRTTV